MNLYCRTLDLSDIAILERLWLEKKTVLKEDLTLSHPTEVRERLASLSKNLNTRWLVFGIFENEVLIATWSVFKWPSLPYYTLTDLFIAGEMSPKAYYEKINLFLDAIIPNMESQKYFNFYILTLLRPYQRKCLLENRIWPIPARIRQFQRYDFQLESIIKKNTVPSEAYFYMMGQRTWNNDLWIRRASLKLEILIPYQMSNLEALQLNEQ